MKIRTAISFVQKAFTGKSCLTEEEQSRLSSVAHKYPKSICETSELYDLLYLRRVRSAKIKIGAFIFLVILIVIGISK